MKQYIKQNGIAMASLLLALPTAYFLGISVLKYEMGIDAPFDTAAPFLERMGIKESLGWNINLLILLGPLVAVVLSIFQVLKIKFQFIQNHFLFQFILKKRWSPLLVAAFSVSLPVVLFIYLAGENCL